MPKGRPRLTDEERDERRQKIEKSAKFKTALKAQDKPNMALSTVGKPVHGFMRSGRFVAKGSVSLGLLAREYGEEALLKIVDLMRNADSGFMQLAAAKELLDRGFGKAKETVHLKDDREVRPVNPEVLTPEMRSKMLEVIDVLDKE